jgi:hypothetical protein
MFFKIYTHTVKYLNNTNSINNLSIFVKNITMKPKLTIYDNCNKSWELPNGKLHREDGPAYEGIDGNKFWYINDELHREDGPAIEYISGNKRWFLNDIQYTENEYKCEMRSRKLKKILH